MKFLNIKKMDSTICIRCNEKLKPKHGKFYSLKIYRSKIKVDEFLNDCSMCKNNDKNMKIDLQEHQECININNKKKRINKNNKKIITNVNIRFKNQT